MYYILKKLIKNGYLVLFSSEFSARIHKYILSYIFLTSGCLIKRQVHPNTKIEKYYFRQLMCIKET
jgi:hypothetical protein